MHFLTTGRNFQALENKTTEKQFTDASNLKLFFWLYTDWRLKQFVGHHLNWMKRGNTYRAFMSIWIVLLKETNLLHQKMSTNCWCSHPYMKLLFYDKRN